MQNMTKTQGKGRLTPPTWLDIRQITDGTWKRMIKTPTISPEHGNKIKIL